MRYAAWDARLAKPVDSGSVDAGSTRAHLERVARGSTPGAIAAQRALEEPHFPNVLGYLWDWSNELRQGVGDGMDGIASLTWSTLDAWARRMDHAIAPHEAQALFTLDAISRHPDAFKEDLT